MSSYAKIEGRVYSFMRKENRNKFLFLKCPPGSGKTTTTMKVLDEEKYNWIYFAPFHKNIRENLALSTFRTYDFVHLQSRKRLCDLDHYKKIAQQGINIRPICENSCPLKEGGCRYYDRKRRVYEEFKPWAGVHHHIISYLKDFFKMWYEGTKVSDTYDVIVIDENPLKVFYDSLGATPKDLMLIYKMIHRLKVNNDMIDDFFDFLVTEFYKDGLDYETLLIYFDQIDFKELYNTYQQELINQIILNKLTVKDVPKLDYLKLFSEIDSKIDPENVEYMIFKTKHQEKERKKSYKFVLFRDTPLPEYNIKMIGMDATGKKHIWETITGKTASVLDMSYKYKNMYQLVTNSKARYPISSWIRFGELTETGKRLIDLIDLIASKKENDVLITGTQRLNKWIDKNTKANNLTFGHYYFLRSRNDFYKECDTLIMASEPNIPPHDFKSFVELSDWDESVWKEIFTDEEMIQAAGRIREQIKYTRGRERNVEIFVFPYITDTENKKLFEEAKEISRTNLIKYLNDGELPENKIERLKNEVLKILPESGTMTKSNLLDQFSGSVVDLKECIRQLLNEAKIDDKGRRGLEKY